jgi:hypothetical protein
MAKKTLTGMPSAKSKVNKIIVRMYRLGTGDFFLLQFKSEDIITFNLMIDCGCINGNKLDFEKAAIDLQVQTAGIIDLLVITHEHSDHINGFELASSSFDKITFKRVWFAWTESKEDELANDLRKNHSKIKLALASASGRLHRLMVDKYFESLFKQEHGSEFMIDGKLNFIKSLLEVNKLNMSLSNLNLGTLPTMEDYLRKNKVIKDKTEVTFHDPGEVIENLEGATGIRFFILGPPKSNEFIKRKEKQGEGYEKRQKPSTIDFAFLNVLDDEGNIISNDLPFDKDYILKDSNSCQSINSYISNHWRKIDNDWLLSAGSLALRHESSINNTSLVIAIQFIDSARVLLFPGDAESSNWESWHEGLKWNINDQNITKSVNAEYILNNTVFYKVGHHLSQNGTAKQKGLEMMIHEDLAAMTALDLNKIMPGWKNTMPNDFIGAELIRKTKGKLFFIGNRNDIIKNIRTNRVTVSKTNLDTLELLNEPFDDQIFIDFEVNG